MSQDNINPGTPPANGQVPGGQQVDGVQPPAQQPQQVDNNTPAPSGSAPASGSNIPEQEQLTPEQIQELKTKAGRFDALQVRKRKERRQNRRPSNSNDSDINDPDLAEAVKVRDDKINELTSENFRINTQFKVSKVLNSDEYKDVSPAIKKAIEKNPMGFVQPGTESVEEAMYDIQDYLDEVLDDIQTNQQPSQQNNQQVNQPANNQAVHQTPPVNPSGPQSPNNAADVDVKGKTGAARSTAILQNLLKNRK